MRRYAPSESKHYAFVGEKLDDVEESSTGMSAGAHFLRTIGSEYATKTSIYQTNQWLA